MNANNVVSLNDDKDSMTPAHAEIETEFNLEMGRAMAMADLLSNCGQGPFELEDGTITTTGCEILSSLKQAQEKFEQLLLLHAHSKDEKPGTQTETA